MLTDILHAFAQNPTDPGLRSAVAAAGVRARRRTTPGIPSGIRSIGFDGDGFCFDNEQPAHQVLLQEAVIARHLVTNGEWLEFMADGGYASHDLWLSDGWAKVEAEGWDAPGYWRNIDGALVLADARRAASRSIRRRRCCTSATTRPTPSRAGPASICRPRPNGRLRPRAGLLCRRLRRGLAMDPQRLSAVSGLPRRRRRARRIQRQVHDQPDGAARIVARDARTGTRA